jgi:hypothetical protein
MPMPAVVMRMVLAANPVMLVRPGIIFIIVVVMLLVAVMVVFARHAIPRALW